MRIQYAKHECYLLAFLTFQERINEPVFCSIDAATETTDDVD